MLQILLVNHKYNITETNNVCTRVTTTTASSYHLLRHRSEAELKMGVNCLVLLRQSVRPTCQVYVHDREVSRFLGYLKSQGDRDLCPFSFTAPCNAFRCNSIPRPHWHCGPVDLAYNAYRGKPSPGVKAAGMLI
jgi:hypothetical protein